MSNINIKMKLLQKIENYDGQITRADLGMTSLRVGSNHRRLFCRIGTDRYRFSHNMVCRVCFLKGARGVSVAQLARVAA